ncbi:MAG: hypothetical protein OXL41_04970 [Nitrospinae bacterium]|nr:hypothetical protein [Nitrospinota bacterium]
MSPRTPGLLLRYGADAPTQDEGVELSREEIAGCALDTTDPEPLPDPHPLRGRENVIINPHAAWYSEESMVGLQQGAPGEVRRVLSGEWPVNVVNRAVRENNRAGL